MLSMIILNSLIKLLKRKKFSLAVAESVSGGYLAYLLTKTPGASSVFKGALIPYSLEAKNKFFKISPSLLKKTQGVSGEIALHLAKGVRKLFNADIGASLVGFAGPKAKKGVRVGTVFMGVADKKDIEVNKIVFKGTRDEVRKKASNLLIKLIYKKLINDSRI